MRGIHAVLLLLVPLAAGCEPSRGERPNIVILVSDDQDWEHFGFLDHPLAHTPTIDALAEEGVVFTHCFVPMSRCRPAQAALLGGQWPHQSGVYFNVAPDHIDPETCLAKLLSDEGYVAWGEGKFWEFEPRSMGFDNRSIMNYETFGREGQQHLFELLEQNAGERPFFLWWAPALPHVPHNPPERLLALFDRASIPVPDWYAGDVDEFREKEHLSLAMEAWLDECIAELMAKLEELGELERTLVVFLIDNGYSNGLPSKGTAFEKGLRTPAILRWPAGIQGGRRFDELTSPVDLYATLLDFAGARTPEETAGQSLRPLLEGRPFEAREALYGAIYLQSPAQPDARPERDAYGLWVRTPRWKYVLYLQDVAEAQDERFHIQANLHPYPERRRGDEDLFDLDADPYERVDLGRRAEHRALMDGLRADVLAWWRETGGGELDLP